MEGLGLGLKASRVSSNFVRGYVREACGPFAAEGQEAFGGILGYRPKRVGSHMTGLLRIPDCRLQVKTPHQAEPRHSTESLRPPTKKNQT